MSEQATHTALVRLAERALMFTALRRLHLRGHLPTIYEAPA